MPITDVLIRSLSGYIFVIPGILLYFLYLRKSGKKQTPLHIVSVRFLYKGIIINHNKNRANLH